MYILRLKRLVLCTMLAAGICVAGCWGASATEVSLCDYLPLHVGNRWISSHYYVIPQGIEVEAESEVNGFRVWEISQAYGDLTGSTTSWYVFTDGWLCCTSDRADLEQLPAITGKFQRFLPESITLNEPLSCAYGTVTPRVGSLFSFLPIAPDLTQSRFPSGDQPDTLVLLGLDGRLLVASFGKGLGFTSSFSPGGLVYDEITVVGGCDADLVVSAWTNGGWHEVGQRLELLVGVTGKSDGLAYAWIKDGVFLAEGTDSTYVVESLQLEDTGRYVCIVSSQSKSSVQTPPVSVTVLEEGSLPVVGGAGLCLLLLGCVAAARRVLR